MVEIESQSSPIFMHKDVELPLFPIGGNFSWVYKNTKFNLVNNDEISTAC